MNYGYSVNGKGKAGDYLKLYFWCDDNEVFQDICDYIERYIDAERWRKEPKQVTVYQDSVKTRL